MVIATIPASLRLVVLGKPSHELQLEVENLGGNKKANKLTLNNSIEAIVQINKCQLVSQIP